MKVSIVIPCYNEKNTIEKILEAVRTAPIERREMIIVDDCSQDGTQAVPEERISRMVDPIIYHPIKAAELRTAADKYVVEQCMKRRFFSSVWNGICNHVAEAGWSSQYRISDKLGATSLLSLSCGALGLVFAGLAVVPKLIRRDLGRSKLELISLALVIFDLLVMVIIIVGRVDNFRENPSEVLAPRYVFWSSLFWVVLLLVAIQRVEPTKWLRWPLFLIALTIPIVAFPSHYKEGWVGDM
jgi:glycosyltransferase involved in cell wall biosynthesis